MKKTKTNFQWPLLQLSWTKNNSIVDIFAWKLIKGQKILNYLCKYLAINYEILLVSKKKTQKIKLFISFKNKYPAWLTH